VLGVNSVTIVVAGLADVNALSTDGSATPDRTCALLEDGTVECLAGYDTNTYPPAPVTLAGLRDVTLLALGDVDDCAVLSVGIIKCWEDNNITKTALVTITGLYAFLVDVYNRPTVTPTAAMIASTRRAARVRSPSKQERRRGSDGSRLQALSRDALRASGTAVDLMSRRLGTAMRHSRSRRGPSE
jgi:hypothetical protein